MGISKNLGGVFRTGNVVWTRVNGVWKIVDVATQRDASADTYRTIHRHLIEASVTAGVHLNAQNYFSATDWASATPKRLIVPAGVIVGSTNTGIPALTTGNGRGGSLEIIIDGEVQGAGGPFNSGAGGPALQALQAIDLIVNGGLRSGGGGGGRGGNGGGGYYHSTEDSGWVYAQTQRVNGTYNQYKMFWWGGYLGQAAGNPASLNHGGYTYHMGAARSWEGGNANSYNIKRTRTLTHYTGGGAGGNGGRGQGYMHGRHAGNAGANGGTNAGRGGNGAWGGTWGANGSKGANGAGGNNGGGAGGSNGGAAGKSILGSGNVSLTNNGTINGPLA